jgi:hypothetical protein
MNEKAVDGLVQAVGFQTFKNVSSHIKIYITHIALLVA